MWERGEEEVEEVVVVGTYEGANKADKISRPWFHVVSENVGNQEQVGR